MKYTKVIGKMANIMEKGGKFFTMEKFMKDLLVLDFFLVSEKFALDCLPLFKNCVRLLLGIFSFWLGGGIIEGSILFHLQRINLDIKKVELSLSNLILPCQVKN